MSARDGTPIGRPAVFLDQDGVLTEPIWNPATRGTDRRIPSPDLVLCPNIFRAVAGAARYGYDFFIVSNQPSREAEDLAGEYSKSRMRSGNFRFFSRASRSAREYYTTMSPAVAYRAAPAARATAANTGLFAPVATDYGTDLPHKW